MVCSRYAYSTYGCTETISQFKNKSHGASPIFRITDMEKTLIILKTKTEVYWSSSENNGTVIPVVCSFSTKYGFKQYPILLKIKIAKREYEKNSANIFKNLPYFFKNLPNFYQTFAEFLKPCLELF